MIHNPISRKEQQRLAQEQVLLIFDYRISFAVIQCASIINWNPFFVVLPTKAKPPQADSAIAFWWGFVGRTKRKRENSARGRLCCFASAVNRKEFVHKKFSDPKKFKNLIFEGDEKIELKL